MSMEPIANPWTARIINAYKKTVEAIIEVGRLLIAAKNDLPHGEFQLMIDRNLPFKARMARVYMQIAADSRLSKRQHAAILPASPDTLVLISRLSDQEFERRLQAGHIHPSMTRKDAAAMVKGEQINMFENSEFFLSGLGRKLERAVEHDEFAPHWLKLNDSSRAIIEEIVEALKSLKKRAARIGEPGEVEKFRAQFARMERRVTERAEEYRRMMKFIERLLADADASLRHVRDD